MNVSITGLCQTNASMVIMVAASGSRGVPWLCLTSKSPPRCAALRRGIRSQGRARVGREGAVRQLEGLIDESSLGSSEKEDL